jgi:SAM-dependent methyltransferase
VSNAVLNAVRKTSPAYDAEAVASLLEDVGWPSARLQIMDAAGVAGVLATSAKARQLLVVPGDALSPASAVALAYSSETAFTLLWTSAHVSLHETRRWRRTPGDTPLATADTDRPINLAGLLGLTSPTELTDPGGTARVHDRGHRHPALPHKLAEAFASLRAALVQQQLWTDRPQEDMGLLRLFHQLLFVRITEDRNRTGGRPRLDETATLADPRAAVARVLSAYDDEFDSDLFAGHRADPLELPAQRLRDVLDALVEPWQQLRLDFSLAPEDIGGRLYESYLKKQPTVVEDLQALIPVVGASDRRYQTGAFYTPAALAERLTSDVLDPWLDEHQPTRPQDVTVLDPACGSGAFLVAAYRRLLQYFGQRQGAPLSHDQRAELLVTSIHGADIDRSALLLAQVQLLEEARLGHGPLPDMSRNLHVGDSLLDPPRELVTRPDAAPHGAVPWTDLHRANGPWDVILANPPFGAQRSSTAGSADYRDTLRELYPATNGAKTDLASRFVELALRLLAPDGSAGFVIPRSVLVGESGLPLRAMLSDWEVNDIRDYRGVALFTGALAYVATLTVRSKPRQPASQSGESRRRPTVRVVEATESTADPALVLDDLLAARAGLLRAGEYAQPLDPTEPWSAFALRWRHTLAPTLTRPWQPLGAAPGVHTAQGTQTGLNARFLLTDDEVLVTDDTASVRGHTVDARLVPKLIRGKKIRRFGFTETGERLLLPPRQRDDDQALRKLVDSLGGAPANVQLGNLRVLLQPKVIVRAWDYDHPAAVDYNGDHIVTKASGGALAVTVDEPTATRLDAIAGLLNSALYQWLMRGLGREKRDATVELGLDDLQMLPWPALDDDDTETIAEAVTSIQSSLRTDDKITRTQAYWAARRELDDRVYDLLGADENLRRIVADEYVARS